MTMRLVPHTRALGDRSQDRKMIDGCKTISLQKTNQWEKEHNQEEWQEKEEGNQLQRRRRKRVHRCRDLHERRSRWPNHLLCMYSFSRHFAKIVFLTKCKCVQLAFYVTGWAILSSLSSFSSPPSTSSRSRPPFASLTIVPCEGFQNYRYIMQRELLHQKQTTTRQYRLLQQEKSVDGDRVVSLDHRSVAVFSLLESRRRTKQKHQQIFSIRVLERNPSFLQLEPRDKAFARLLLSTVERREGQIDKVLSSFMTRTGRTKNQQPVDHLCNAALKVGAAQLLFLDIPKYAAIQETVQVLRRHPTIHVPAPQIKFVNAVLRSVDREGSQRLVETTSVLDNVDPWLCGQWIKSYGRSGTETIVSEAMSQSPIFISINQDPNASYTERQAQLRRMQQIFSPTSTAANAVAASVDTDNTTVDEGNTDEPCSLLLPHGSICVNTKNVGSVVSKWPYFDEGEWWVQDAAASVPAIALENALTKRERNRKKLRPSEEGEALRIPPCDENLLHNLNVVDLCSAPGGKTAQLCSMGFGTVTAIEISKKRSRVLEQNLNRLGMLKPKNQSHKGIDSDDDSDSGIFKTYCQIVIEDGSAWTPASMNVDGILVDAPCSASGVGSRQPDVLRKSFKDILPDLLRTQRKLAAHAVDNILQPDGVIVYATCSLLKQEGEDQAKWLLDRGENDKSASQLEPIPFEVGEIAGFDDFIDDNGWLRILPGIQQGPLAHVDGFFVARMKKIK